MASRIIATLTLLVVLVLYVSEADARRRGRWVRIFSRPRGAQVFLDSKDGELLGKTPIRRVRVAFGNHDFIFVKKGYRTKTVSKRITRRTRRVVTRLTEIATFDLRAGNELARGAEVTIDGEAVGKLPYKGEVEPGRHEINVTKAQAQPFSQWLDAKAGQVVTLPISLQPAEKAKGTVFVTADVEGAAVFIDGTQQGSTPLSLDLEPGPVLIEIKAPDKPPWSKTVEVKAEQKHIVQAKLTPEKSEKAKGTLIVTADVESVPVLVDGEKRGATPLSLELEAGPVLLELKPAELPAWTKTVEVTAGEKNIVRAEIQPESQPTGTLLVLSNVEQTKVKVDGTPKGEAPASVKKLMPGTHLVEGEAEGYQATQQTADVTAGKQTVVKLELEPQKDAFGSISVRASVPEAEVYVDGGKQGPAPVEMSEVPLGPHAIVVRREGYRDFKANCEVRANEVCHVMANLTPLAKIRVESNATGGRLFVDGEEVGPVPFELSLPAGEHTFRIEADGYLPAQQRVQLQASTELRTIQITLKSDGPTPEQIQARKKRQRRARAMREAERRAKHDGASTYSGVPIAPGFNTIELSTGVPYLMDVRATVGIHHYVDVSVAARAFERALEFGLAELGIRASSGIRPIDAFSFGGYAEIWGGTDFDESGGFGLTAGVQPTLHFAERATFSLGFHVDAFRDSWANRAAIGSDVQAAYRARLSTHVLYWLNRTFGVFGGLEYRVLGEGRQMFQGMWFNVWSQQDPTIYFKAGVNFGFSG